MHGILKNAMFVVRKRRKRMETIEQSPYCNVCHFRWFEARCFGHKQNYSRNHLSTSLSSGIGTLWGGRIWQASGWSWWWCCRRRYEAMMFNINKHHHDDVTVPSIPHHMVWVQSYNSTIWIANSISTPWHVGHLRPLGLNEFSLAVDHQRWAFTSICMKSSRPINKNPENTKATLRSGFKGAPPLHHWKPPQISVFHFVGSMMVRTSSSWPSDPIPGSVTCRWWFRRGGYDKTYDRKN